MSSRNPISGSGLVARLADIWADISYAQRRIVELNQPRRAKTER